MGPCQRHHTEVVVSRDMHRIGLDASQAGVRSGDLHSMFCYFETLARFKLAPRLLCRQWTMNRVYYGGEESEDSERHRSGSASIRCVNRVAEDFRALAPF